MFWLQRQRCLVGLLRLIGSLRRGQRDAQIVPGARIAGLILCERLIPCDRLRNPPRFPIGRRQPQPRGPVLRRPLERLLVGRRRGCIVVPSGVGLAQIAPGCRRGWVDRRRLLEGADRLLHLLHVELHQPKVVPGLVVILPLLDRLPIGRHSRLRLLCVPLQRAQVEPAGGIEVVTQPDRFGVGFARRLDLARARSHQAEHELVVGARRVASHQLVCRLTRQAWLLELQRHPRHLGPRRVVGRVDRQRLLVGRKCLGLPVLPLQHLAERELHRGHIGPEFDRRGSMLRRRSDVGRLRREEEGLGHRLPDLHRRRRPLHSILECRARRLEVSQLHLEPPCGRRYLRLLQAAAPTEHRPQRLERLARVALILQLVRQNQERPTVIGPKLRRLPKQPEHLAPLPQAARRQPLCQPAAAVLRRPGDGSLRQGHRLVTLLGLPRHLRMLCKQLRARRRIGRQQPVDLQRRLRLPHLRNAPRPLLLRPRGERLPAALDPARAIRTGLRLVRPRDDLVTGLVMAAEPLKTAHAAQKETCPRKHRPQAVRPHATSLPAAASAAPRPRPLMF